ncbi:peptidoglycan-binding protein [Planctomycetota bacterium]
MSGISGIGWGALGGLGVPEGPAAESETAAAATTEIKSSILSGNADLEAVAAGTKTIGYYTDSEAVRALQLGLEVVGYKDARSKPDGKYGRKTESIVSRFQRDKGLPATGQVDAKTLAALDAAFADADAKDSIAGGTLTYGTLRSDAELQKVAQGETTLSRGVQGDHVKGLQKALVAARYYVGSAGPDGDFGPSTLAAVKGFQQAHGITPANGEVNAATLLELDRAASKLEMPWVPHPTALAKARTTDLCRRIDAQLSNNAETYLKAEELTGVPAEVVAAVHANESWMSEAANLGPESGFGLDDRYVTTEWGNEQLQKHNLGTWERGKKTDTATLQSAVIAAEHLKRMGALARVTVREGMSRNDYSGLITAYAAGGSAGRSARSAGRSWAFDPNDASPHPLHPGGTSRGPGGTTITVAPARKPGLLRWDVLLPLLQEKLEPHRANP